MKTDKQHLESIVRHTTFKYELDNGEIIERPGVIYPAILKRVHRNYGQCIPGTGTSYRMGDIEASDEVLAKIPYMRATIFENYYQDYKEFFTKGAHVEVLVYKQLESSNSYHAQIRITSNRFNFEDYITTSIENNITDKLLERLKKRYLDCESDFFKHEKKITKLMTSGVGYEDANFKMALNDEIHDIENQLSNLDEGTERGIPWVSKDEILLYKTEIKLIREILSEWDFEKFATVVRERHEQMLAEKFKNQPFIFESIDTVLDSAFKIKSDESDYSSDLDSSLNNEYYNDQLDMDQQDPEFWDNL